MAQMTATAFPTTQGNGSFLSRFIEDRRAARARRAVYTQTVRELGALSDRDLADIGIGRSDIRRIAREATRVA